MYCLAKWTQRTLEIITDRWLWKVTLRPQQRETLPKRRGPTPPVPHHPTALPVHGGSPAHGAAVAGPRHPVPKLPPPHGGGHARHPAMLLQHPGTPPANAPTRPGAEVDPPRITLVLAEPRQRHHTSTYTCTSSGTHAGDQGKRAHRPGARTRTLVLSTHRTQHLTPTPTAQDPPPSPTALHSPSDSTTYDHNHLIHHRHHILVQHTTHQAARKASRTGPKSCPHREQARCCQGPRPSAARACSPAATQDRRQAGTQTRRRTTASARSQIQAQG